MLFLESKGPASIALLFVQENLSHKEFGSSPSFPTLRSSNTEPSHRRTSENITCSSDHYAQSTYMETLCCLLALLFTHSLERGLPCAVVTPFMRFCAPPATSPMSQASRERQPSSPFLRVTTDYQHTSSPTLFHVGATHGVQRGQCINKLPQRKGA